MNFGVPELFYYDASFFVLSLKVKLNFKKILFSGGPVKEQCPYFNVLVQIMSFGRYWVIFLLL